MTGPRTLQATGLCYARGGRDVLVDVSLQARSGEVLAVTGPSGSGKSTLLALLARLERPDAGEVRVEGGEPAYGIVLQGYGLISVLTAAENVEIALQPTRLPRAELRERSARALADVGLPEVGDHLVEQLSGGQQQRVAVARALVTRPDVLVADEPTAELDAVNRTRVLDLLFAAADAGAVVVLATHDRSVAERCPAEVGLTEGRVTERRSTASVPTAPPEA
jgi:ABC-type lipoprotein export system ATPase subunit